MGTVGRSRRTPAKHESMYEIARKEVAVINSRRMSQEVNRMYWIDKTAGDGVADEGATWDRGCSPGIMASCAIRSKIPVDIVLYEIKPAVFDKLLASLEEHLPFLGYRKVGDSHWRCGNVTLRAINASGSNASLEGIHRKTEDGRNVAILVFNDPNSIADWAMRPTFASEARGCTPWFRSISTLGCNVGGIKRLTREERQEWFRHVEAQERALPPHRDLLLVAIDGDDQQWAYLINDPRKWRDDTAAYVKAAFAKFGYMVRYAWYRACTEEYQSIKDYLFLTKPERSE